jgi:hypothetical protein
VQPLVLQPPRTDVSRTAEPPQRYLAPPLHSVLLVSYRLDHHHDASISLLPPSSAMVASRHGKNRQLVRKAKILVFDLPRTRDKIYRLEFRGWQHHAVTGDHPDKTPSSEYPRRDSTYYIVIDRHRLKCIRHHSTRAPCTARTVRVSAGFVGEENLANIPRFIIAVSITRHHLEEAFVWTLSSPPSLLDRHHQTPLHPSPSRPCV